MAQIELLKGDITKINADAIVNAANSSLLGGGGVDGSIHRSGGNEIIKECIEYVSIHGELPTGHAMIASGGNLPSKFVIHTVGPVWNGGNSKERELLKSAYRNSLLLAAEKKLKTIAFPNISTGVYRFPKEEAVVVAIAAVKEFLQENTSIEKVSFVCFDEENYQLYLEELNELD